jgi:hypothetical protein
MTVGGRFAASAGRTSRAASPPVPVP